MSTNCAQFNNIDVLLYKADNGEVWYRSQDILDIFDSLDLPTEALNAIVPDKFKRRRSSTNTRYYTEYGVYTMLDYAKGPKTRAMDKWFHTKVPKGEVCA